MYENNNSNSTVSRNNIINNNYNNGTSTIAPGVHNSNNINGLILNTSNIASITNSGSGIGWLSSMTSSTEPMSSVLLQDRVTIRGTLETTVMRAFGCVKVNIISFWKY